MTKAQRHCLFGSLWLLAQVVVCGVESSNSPNHPYLRLREATLGYHGTDADFTNLTEIRIGWFGPTNLNDPLTGDLWWAANFAIREANERVRLNRLAPNLNAENSKHLNLPYRLVPRWAVDPWGTGVSQLTRMVYDEQPLALIGSVDSATTHLAEQVVAKANLPLVSPIATDKSITLAGVSWMFSSAPSDAAIARALAGAIVASQRDSGGKLVLLATTDHESRMTAREVVRELSRCGHLPDFRLEMPPGAADFAGQIQAAAEAKPSSVLVIAGVSDAARLVKAVRARFGNVAIFGSHSMSRIRFLEQTGSAAEGVRFPLLFAPNAADTNSTRFVARFTSERHHPPDYTAALTYDSTRLLLEAIRRAGPSRARIREALAQLSPWSGIAGPITFDGTGQNTRTNICLGTIRDGVIVPLPAHTDSATTASNNPPQ